MENWKHAYKSDFFSFAVVFKATQLFFSIFFQLLTFDCIQMSGKFVWILWLVRNDSERKIPTQNVFEKIIELKMNWNENRHLLFLARILIFWHFMQFNFALRERAKIRK